MTSYITFDCSRIFILDSINDFCLFNSSYCLINAALTKASSVTSAILSVTLSIASVIVDNLEFSSFRFDIILKL